MRPGARPWAALDLVPGAVAWVQRLGPPARISPKIFASRCAPTMMRCAVDGIVASDTADRDARLRALLETAITACPAPMPMRRVSEVAW